MPALVFLVLVGLFAHSVFVPAGPVLKPETTLPKVVVINTAGQVIDTWQQNTKGEIVVEVPVIEEEDIAGTEPVEVSEEESEAGTAEELPPTEEETADPVEKEEVIEEAFEAPSVVEDPLLVIEEEAGEENIPELPVEENLVEALLQE